MPDETEWRRDCLTAGTVQVLEHLRDEWVLSDFYLAGGAGLALRFGHRVSEDLGFFNTRRFDEDALLQTVQTLDRFELKGKDAAKLHAQIQGVKVTFIGYAYPVLFPFQTFLDVKVADPRDIACMKISAIAGRGTRRDFVDLYAAALRYGLAPLLDLFQEKFRQANYSMVHVLKSLTWFDDAEKEPMPALRAPLPWPDVKRFFTGHAPGLL